MKGFLMSDSFLTTVQTCCLTICSFLMLHLSEVEAFITFLLTVTFLFYKIKEARAKAKAAEQRAKRLY